MNTNMNGMNSWNWLDWLAMILVIVGALNWGLVGVGGLLDSNLNLVNLIFGFSPAVENIVYLLVGLAGVYAIYLVGRQSNGDWA